MTPRDLGRDLGVLLLGVTILAGAWAVATLVSGDGGRMTAAERRDVRATIIREFRK